MTKTYDDARCKASESPICFPEDPFFTKLLATAERHGDSIIIRDETDSTEATYSQLLFDVHTLRQALQDRLSSNLLDSNGMVKEEGMSIAIIARGGYKFLVASIAIFAIGAVVLPLSKC
jgi:acyl-CoA synthetase (AMP-forming)/AMP-acid ligase II